MILSYLIFSHLLGDFVFQPERLVAYKMRSIKGVLLHVTIHFILGNLVLLPFIVNGYEWLIGLNFGICFFHFLIDQAKINYDLKHDNKVQPFVIDQLLHLLTILVAYFFISDIDFKLPNTWGHEIYSNINIIIFLAILIFLSTAIETYRYQILREKDNSARFRPNQKKVFIRITVFSAIYLFFIFLAFYATK